MNDLGKAFSFPFKDPNWVAKFLLGALFMVLSIFLVGIFIIAGYFVQVIQRVMRREANPLPEWEDVGVKLVLGFKFCVVYLVYILPIILFMIPFFVLMIFGIISGNGEAIGLLASMYMILLVVIMIPYSLVLTILHPIIAYRFAARERISDALDVGAVVRSFKRNWQNTLIVALVAVGIQSFAAIGVAFFIIGILFTILYAYLVTAYMYGALYLEQTQEEMIRP
jgi:hypothetical protein